MCLAGCNSCLFDAGGGGGGRQPQGSLGQSGLLFQPDESGLGEVVITSMSNLTGACSSESFHNRLVPHSSVHSSNNKEKSWICRTFSNTVVCSPDISMDDITQLLVLPTSCRSPRTLTWKLQLLFRETWRNINQKINL